MKPTKRSLSCSKDEESRQDIDLQTVPTVPNDMLLRFAAGSIFMLSFIAYDALSYLYAYMY